MQKKSDPQHLNKLLAHSAGWKLGSSICQMSGFAHTCLGAFAHTCPCCNNLKSY